MRDGHHRKIIDDAQTLPILNSVFRGNIDLWILMWDPGLYFFAALVNLSGQSLLFSNDSGCCFAARLRLGNERSI
jgi:hypothetical protein